MTAGVLAVMDSLAIDCVWERDENNANGNEVRGETWERNRANLREASATVAELIEALRQSNDAMALARARWPFQPSPAQMPAFTACMEATARNKAALARACGDA